MAFFESFGAEAKAVKQTNVDFDKPLRKEV